MRILITTIVVLVILVSATITNPTRDDFINWGVAEIRGQAESDIERIFEGTVAAPMLELETEVNDYVFFSVFRLQKAEKEFKYLGVFNNFFDLN